MAKKRKTNSTLSPEVEQMKLAIAEIAAESWRYSRAVSKVLRKLDVMDADRFARQYEYFTTRVQRAVVTAGLTVLDLTGQAYHVGLPVQAMNLEEFDEDEPLLIAQTIEPVIMMDGRVVKTGVVMVAASHDAEGEAQ
ncbi:MAG: hypothetical protein ACI4O7_15760 [Aristaeellaceae bacterium]